MLCGFLLKEEGYQCEVQKTPLHDKVSNTSWFAEVPPNLELLPRIPSALENIHILLSMEIEITKDQAKAKSLFYVCAL